MRIVMDFDGVYTDPSHEGVACSRSFRDKILSLQMKEVGLETIENVESWLGELRARQASQPFQFGWRSEGRVSAFAFEDPFIRNIGLADYLDSLVAQGDTRAKKVLARLKQTEKIHSFGELSEWSFLQLAVKKAPDHGAKAWVMKALEKGHEVYIVSNSATLKIEEFLTQNDYPEGKRPLVRGGARKFGLGKKPRPFLLSKTADFNVEVDTDRPEYEKLLLEIKPDAVIGDVFSLDLTLPIRLKREGKLSFNWGIFYRHRDYTPSQMVEFVTGRGTQVPEVTLIREWSQVWT
ncbi:MAG: hypothetical protein H7333_11790 [Bdellovibrionales bacterium]|nr:hypothetical protein [Oligoflexia bacterium]